MNKLNFVFSSKNKLLNYFCRFKAGREFEFLIDLIEGDVQIYIWIMSFPQHENQTY